MTDECEHETKHLIGRILCNKCTNGNVLGEVVLNHIKKERQRILKIIDEEKNRQQTIGFVGSRHPDYSNIIHVLKKLKQKIEANEE